MALEKPPTHLCGYETDSGPCEVAVHDDRDREHCFIHDAILEREQNPDFEDPHLDALQGTLTARERRALEYVAKEIGEPESARDAGLKMAAESRIRYERDEDDEFHLRFLELFETFGAPLDEKMYTEN